MKNLMKLITLAVATMMFSSCCGLFPCGGRGMSAEVEYTEYEDATRTVVPAGKGGMPYEESYKRPVTKTKTVKDGCFTCGSSYCPASKCCGIVSDEVLARATTQGGTGEPQLGLIPTMKPLAP
ncbi:hypothetical protein [Persicirhabdus sediminis]|uniref:Lipoprotein n=1 Tax=Persicirhabdus sediminis TaxID=454144 RepID=A0A8J7MBN4_9BACT|nr:hypothetical protein [Persicirhabdus sediminis]MBK1789613.1 hypothetical protein [Persicirhabdus sediminis]